MNVISVSVHYPLSQLEPSYQYETGALSVRSCRKKVSAYRGAIPTGPPDPILKMSNSEGAYFLPVYFEEEKNRGLNKNLNFTSARSHVLPEADPLNIKVATL